MAVYILAGMLTLMGVIVTLWPPESRLVKVGVLLFFIGVGFALAISHISHDYAIIAEAQKMAFGDPENPPYIRIPIIYLDRGLGRVILANSSQYPAFNVQPIIIDIDTGNRICCNRTFEELYPSDTASVSNPILMNLLLNQGSYRWRTSIRTRAGVYDQKTWLLIHSDGWDEAWIVKNDKGVTVLEGSNPQEFQADWLLFDSGG